MPSRTYCTPKGSTLSWIRHLGKGQFGVAQLVRNRQGQQFVLKEVSVHTRDESAKREVLREVELMRETDHVNVVKYYDSWFDRRCLYIVMEFCENGSLDIIINKFNAEKKRFLEDKIVNSIKELSGALAFMHDSLRIMHRDIKPANIFVDEIGTLKLGDFGLSKSLGHEHLAATFVGTPIYMSPEQCNGETYSFAADVWAVGCVIYEMMALRSPWTGGRDLSTYPALVAKINQANPRYDHLQPLYSTTVINATKWMLRHDPKKRPTASDMHKLMQPQEISLDTSLVANKNPPIPQPHPPPSSPHISTDDVTLEVMASIEKVQVLVEEATKLAAMEIQRSFRLSVHRRRMKDTESKKPTPQVLVPMDRTGSGGRQNLKGSGNKNPPPASDETKPLDRLQTALRRSLNRKRYARGGTPQNRYATRQLNLELHPPPSPQGPPQLSTRLTELAAPRARLVRAPSTQHPIPARQAPKMERNAPPKLPTVRAPTTVRTPRPAWS